MINPWYFLICNIIAICLILVLVMGSARVYLMHKIKPILLLLIASGLFLLSYVFHLIAILCGDLTLAEFLFRCFLSCVVIALILFLAFAMIVKYPRFPYRFLIPTFLAGGLTLLRATIVRFRIEYMDSLIIPISAPEPLVLDTILLAIISTWTIAEWMHLLLLQRKIVDSRTRKFLMCALLGLLLITFIGITYPLTAIGIFPQWYLHIISFTAVPVEVMLFGISYLVKPELAYVIVARAKGLLILTYGGMPVYSNVTNKRLSELLPMISGFIVAISQFGKNVLPGAGKLNYVSFEYLHMFLAFTRNLVICLIVDKPIEFHRLLIKEISKSLLDIEIPEIITRDTTKLVEKRLERYVTLLLS